MKRKPSPSACQQLNLQLSDEAEQDGQLHTRGSEGAEPSELRLLVEGSSRTQKEQERSGHGVMRVTAEAMQVGTHRRLTG